MGFYSTVAEPQKVRRKNATCIQKITSDIPYWLSRDLIEEDGGMNLYGFVANSAIDRWDRLGLKFGYTGGVAGNAAGGNYAAAAKAAQDLTKTKKSPSNNIIKDALKTTRDIISDLSGILNKVGSDVNGPRSVDITSNPLPIDPFGDVDGAAKLGGLLGCLKLKAACEQCRIQAPLRNEPCFTKKCDEVCEDAERICKGANNL